MDVVDGLAASFVAVEYVAKAWVDDALVVRDGVGPEDEPPEEFRIIFCRVGNPLDVFAGNDEDMRGGGGANVVKGEEVIVFIDFFRGDIAARNLTEQAVCCHVILPRAKQSECCVAV